MSADPYQILGLDRNASEEDIRKAYRRLAKQYHPDLNRDNAAAAARFKDVGAAYDFLKDRDRRAAFDRCEIDMDGHPQWPGAGRRSGFGGGFGAGGASGFSGQMNPEDLGGIFSSFFGGGAACGGGFEDVFRAKQPAEVQYGLEVDFLDAALGARKVLTLPEGATLNVTIPAGVKDGQKLRLAGKGRKKPDGRMGDAFVFLRIRPHKYFTRKDNDIYCDLPVGLHEAVLGGAVDVETIHGPVRMNLPSGTSSGRTLRLKGKGIKGGNHYAQVRIILPEKIDPQLEDVMRKWATQYGYNPRENRASV